MNPDVIPPAIALPAAAVLWAVWGVLAWRDRRKTR